eukprot:568740-Pleurochrysis_carterae.AAC.2
MGPGLGRRRYFRSLGACFSGAWMGCKARYVLFETRTLTGQVGRAFSRAAVAFGSSHGCHSSLISRCLCHNVPAIHFPLAACMSVSSES